MVYFGIVCCTSERGFQAWEGDQTFIHIQAILIAQCFEIWTDDIYIFVRKRDRNDDRGVIQYVDGAAICWSPQSDHRYSRGEGATYLMGKIYPAVRLHMALPGI
jgi:hypothetical protein